MTKAQFLVKEFSELLYLQSGYTRLVLNSQGEEKDYNSFVLEYFDGVSSVVIEHSRRVSKKLVGVLKKYKTDFLTRGVVVSRDEHEKALSEIFDSCLAVASHQRAEPETGTETDAPKPENV
ncbi:MAG: hypothetical protein Q4C70_05010 [Planctomycetia bacterium]|nr:hypothetical protein [Planctomycetia bacterium]